MYVILFFSILDIVIFTSREAGATTQENCITNRETCANSNTTDFYCNKVMLAPMVRMNTLPLRLLALDYGADIVYSEEIVDHCILRCRRFYNEFFQTVDYVDMKDGTLVFRTSPREKERLIFQLGTSDPERAAQAAKFVSNDVAGIDINMGCPVHFSTVGGMGVELLSDPAKARKIIEHVRRTVDLPVTCKIRVHDDINKTISFCQEMIDGGVAAIAVHGRTRKERPRHRNRLHAIKNVSSSFSIPVIAKCVARTKYSAFRAKLISSSLSSKSGESDNINTYEDILSIRDDSGCTSIMIARAAQSNPSIFRKEGKLPINDVVKAYLEYAIHYDNIYQNNKYCLESMLEKVMNTPERKALSAARSNEEICKIWDMDTYWRRRMNELNCSSSLLQSNFFSENEKKKLEIDAMLRECHSIHYKFHRDNFDEGCFPKNVLITHSVRCRVPLPKYYAYDADNKYFRAVVTFGGKNFSSTYWEKNKRSAEQAAAVVCLFLSNVYTKHELRPRDTTTVKPT